MRETSANVLLIGSGGREHVGAHALLRSPDIGKLYVAPGNDGMFFGEDRNPRLQRLDIRADTPNDIRTVVDTAKELKIDLVFVGPEKPLSLGVVDELKREGIPVVGPTRKAAELEGNKAQTKDILKSLGIPIPEYAHFDNPNEAREYIVTREYPVVVKASGLAAGKGSIVTDNQTQAFDAVTSIMIEKKFGDAGDTVVIEKRLFGEEFSFFAFTDGETILPLAWARDYKQVGDGDTGLNTGGMGGYSPYREGENIFTETVMKRIALPLVHGCREKHGFTYQGILYVGGAFVEENGSMNPYVFEINVRMGDPEAQVIYPRLTTKLFDISMATAEGRLSDIGELEWNPNHHVCICATSGRTRGSKGWYSGYPGRYATGKPISGLDTLNPETLIFHSGTKYEEERKQFVTDGGRVLSVVSSGTTLEEATNRAYSEIEKIDFPGMHYRRDIGSTKI